MLQVQSESQDQSKQYNFLCIFNKCDQQSRYVETELEYLSHQHKFSNQDHIISSQQLKTFIQQLYAKQYIQEQQKLEQFVESLNKIIDLAQKLIAQLQYQYNNEMQQYQRKINGLLDDTSGHKQHQKQFIDDLLHFNILYNEKHNINTLQQIIKECQEFRNFSFFQGIEYYDYYKKEIKPNCLNGCQISNNQKILLTVERKKIQITNLVNKQNVKLTSRYTFNCSQLSVDSKLLFCGGSSGQIFCFHVNKLKLIYRTESDLKLINFIKPISDKQLIICSKINQSVIILDLFKKNETMRTKNAHFASIYSMDYDQILQIIITGSYDKSIKFISVDGQILIDQVEAHSTPIYAIQNLKNNTLLSNGGIELKIWKIDYSSKFLTVIRQLSDNNFIYASQSVLGEQIIIKIHQKYLEILDKNLNLVQKIQHNIHPLKVIHTAYQLDNLNYIIIEGQSFIKVMKKSVL